MTDMPTELNRSTGTIQATCWCGAKVEATTMPCPCGGGITITEHPGCGTTISGGHSQGCTYITDNIDTCGGDTEICGGNNIFTKRDDSRRCHLPDARQRSITAENEPNPAAAAN